jgi:hypothetical protein
MPNPLAILPTPGLLNLGELHGRQHGAGASWAHGYATRPRLAPFAAITVKMINEVNASRIFGLCGGKP